MHLRLFQKPTVFFKERYFQKNYVFFDNLLFLLRLFKKNGVFFGSKNRRFFEKALLIKKNYVLSKSKASLSKNRRFFEKKRFAF